MKTIVTTAALICVFLATSTIADDKAPWSYSGLNGPSYWGKLSPDYLLCSTGKNQSPIDLTGFINIDLPQITFNYTATGNQVENNGHIIEINYKPGSSISIEGHIYELEQTQFHTPSETTINGKSYPMEAHLIHADKEGAILIIAVLFEQGDDNKALHHDWMKMLYKKHTKHLLYKNINTKLLLPDNRDYYQFTGSLTTPPCTEDVLWIVMKEPSRASKEQIEKLRNVVHNDNNRPLQAINSRSIFH